MSYEDEIKVTLSKLEAEHKKLLTEAYDRGFQDGVAIVPDHEQFHKGHQEPRDYGEDGEIYVLSGRFDEDEALAKFKAYFKGEGFEWEDISIGRTKIAVPSDQTDEYEYSRKGTGVYDAWVWTA